MTTIRQLSDRKIRNKLVRWYGYANADETVILTGLNWYKQAQDFVKEISFTYCISSYTVAGVVSALSPNNKWERNKIDTIAVIEAFQAGKGDDDVKVCTYNCNKTRAFEILRGNKTITERSPKTHAFAMNVGLLSPTHITIDKWHLRACQCRPCDDRSSKLQETVSPLQYRRIEHITAELAHQYGYKGYEFQAIIWCAIKQNWEQG